MDIVQVSNTAKSVLNDNEYAKLMKHINNRDLSTARIFIEDKIDEIIFSRKVGVFNYEKLKSFKKLDSIITNEYINNIDVKNATRVNIK